MAASIPVLRTLFRDLNTISRKYYVSESKSATQTQSSRAATSRYMENTVVICADPPPPEDTVRSDISNESIPVCDSCGQIYQSTEVMIAVEYRKEGSQRHLPLHAF
jgi:hypothetical protein